MTSERISRRRMLAATAGAAITATLAVGASSPGRQRRAPRRPRGFRLGVCDWTIGKRTNPGAFELAKKIGLDGVQVDFGSGEKDLPLFEPELQKRYLEETKRQNVRIASLAMGTLNNVPYKSDPRTERWIDQAIDVAKAMRQRVILLAFFGKGDLKGDTAGTSAVVSRLKKVAPKAEQAGVMLGIESWLSAAEHMDIIDRVGSPAVKVYYDVANSHKAGYDIYKEIRTLGKHICQFHAKDYDDLYGKGSIDFERVREAMDAIGYRGWIVMEGTKMPLGVEQSCRYDAEYLRTIFPRRVS